MRNPELSIIPSKLNLVLVFSVQIVALLLLWLGSKLEVVWSVPLGIVFSFLLLTNYALMHEGTHRCLHEDRKMNWLLGTISSFLFPLAFTFFEITHQVHHRGNRTDHEMFDYYYPTDNLFVKWMQWYGILAGFFWIFVPIGSLIMSIWPGALYTRPFRRAKSAEILFDDFTSTDVLKVRVETLFTIIYWISIWQLLSLNWQSVAIMYAFFAFNWSTRQYVTHAWTPRDVIEGATNLKVSKPMSMILLNGNWDLVHHRYPQLPWTELPKKASNTRAPISYWKQYFSLWKGPRRNFEEAPVPLKDLNA